MFFSIYHGETVNSTWPPHATGEKAKRKSCKKHDLMLYFNLYNYRLGGLSLEGFGAWLRQLQFTSLLDLAMVVVAAVLSITVHETSHGFMAWKLGDPTAKNAGRLTLNPLKHIDIMGLLLLAIAKFGWAKPVPIDARYFKNPKTGMALTALAGPLSNVLLAFVAMLLRNILILVIYTRGETMLLLYLLDFLAYVAIINAGLAVFNLFPIPPLDGSKILGAFLPWKAWIWVLRYERYGMIAMAVLLLTGLLDAPLNFLRGGLIEALGYLSSFPLQFL